MVGIGALNVLLPPLVRRYFPNRVGGVTSMYLVLLGLGASAPAFAAVQLAETIGWRGAIGVWLVIPLLALVPWLANLRAHGVAGPVAVPDVAAESPSEVRRVVTSPTTWAITAAFALSSISAYAAFAYLPAMLTAAAVTPAVAGFALGLVMVVGIPEALIVPVLATRASTVLPMLVVAGLCGVGGWVGMLLAPASAPFLWAVLIGLVPIAFPLALLLVNTRTRDHRVTVSVSAFVQGVGYVAAGVFALGVGLLHDVTGDWRVPTIALLATMGLVVPAVLILRRNRSVDDEITRSRAPQLR
jgi:CP family cyanate transporter-like MFS transporter